MTDTIHSVTCPAAISNYSILDYLWVQDWLDKNAPGCVVEVTNPCYDLLPLLEGGFNARSE